MKRDNFIDFTNHPSALWDERQRAEALKYGTIRDIPFPAVEPLGDSSYIEKLAVFYINAILELCPKAVLCQGEFCLAYHVIKGLQEKGIVVLAACSERIVTEVGGKKTATFIFRLFRRY